MVNKKGWIRILEATLAVLLVSGVLVVVYSKQEDRISDSSEYIYDVQKEILEEISSNSTLRGYVLQTVDGNVPEPLLTFVSNSVPNSFEARIRVCDLTQPPKPCKLLGDDFVAAGLNDLYVLDTIISANYSNYSPKKVRIFVWENA